MWQGRASASVLQTRNGEGLVGCVVLGRILGSAETTIFRSNEKWNPLVDYHFEANDRGSKLKIRK